MKYKILNLLGILSIISLFFGILGLSVPAILEKCSFAFAWFNAIYAFGGIALLLGGIGGFAWIVILIILSCIDEN